MKSSLETLGIATGLGSRENRHLISIEESSDRVTESLPIQAEIIQLSNCSGVSIQSLVWHPTLEAELKMEEILVTPDRVTASVYIELGILKLPEGKVSDGSPCQ